LLRAGTPAGLRACAVRPANCVACDARVGGAFTARVVRASGRWMAHAGGAVPHRRATWRRRRAPRNAHYTAAQQLGDADAHRAVRVYALAIAGAHCAATWTPALRWVQRARANAQRANQPRGVADCYIFEGVVRRARGEYDQALAAYRAGIQASEQAQYPLGVARCIANTGLVYWTMGLYEDARLHYREAMTRFQQLGADWDVATCTLNTAILLQHDGDYEGALELYAQAQRRYEALGDTEGVAYCLLNRAAVYDDMRQHARAAQTAHQAATLFDRLQIPLQAVQARQLKANRAAAGQTSRAARASRSTPPSACWRRSPKPDGGRAPGVPDGRGARQSWASSAPRDGSSRRACAQFARCPPCATRLLKSWARTSVSSARLSRRLRATTGARATGAQRSTHVSRARATRCAWHGTRP
jgi:tetratricopeptide (TPR) repeat protein